MRWNACKTDPLEKECNIYSSLQWFLARIWLVRLKTHRKEDTKHPLYTHRHRIFPIFLMTESMAHGDTDVSVAVRS